MAVLVLGAASCKGRLVAPSTPTEACDDGTGPPATPPPPSGEALYAEKCAVCHGETGGGGLGPAIVNSPKSESDLAAFIDQQMPPSNPDACRGDCAASVAGFIKSSLTTQALGCNGVQPSPRRLRLLTRREYRETVRDLFSAMRRPPTHCSKASECAFDQTCDGGYCEALPCGAHEFVFDPHGAHYDGVHVAGSFNGWTASSSAGGWPLRYDAQSGLWTGSFDVPDGTNTYKFVLDGSTWVADARDPDAVSDGYGGSNSSITMSCASEPDPSANVPAEARPDGFVFDDASDAAMVTTDHIDAWLAAAESIGAAQADLPSGCDPSMDAAACATQFVTRFGLLAFRRPLTPDEVQRYAAIVTGESDLQSGVRLAIESFLLSPDFLYRSEIGVPQGDGTSRLDGYEVASALSYALWGTMPDQALLDAAASGALDTPDGVQAQAKRMLASPRARRQLGVFASQWLGTENVLTVDKNATLYPAFTDAVRSGMDEETRRFVEHVAFETSAHSFDELFTSNETFVNDDLASFYGLSAPGGPGFRAAPWPDASRPGLLGQGSVMTAFSHSNQTSPVKRGLFVRRRLLCEDLPPPPPNVGAVPEVDDNQTTRQRFEQHEANANCANCHTYIDHVGFGFEHYDPVGRYRETENGLAIDASGDMSDVDGLGTSTSAPFQDLAGLAARLAASETPKACFARQYYRFARGFHETLNERCARTQILDDFHQHGDGIQALMLAVTRSPDFTVRK